MNSTHKPGFEMTKDETDQFNEDFAFFDNLNEPAEEQENKQLSLLEELKAGSDEKD